jgi:hypothetical protein
MEMIRIPEAGLQKGFRAPDDRARREPVAIRPMAAATSWSCCQLRNVHA